ncbi:MAG TPA: peptidoglycan-binding domain-containing protein [Candidatus Paceibacterota bacterium]
MKKQIIALALLIGMLAPGAAFAQTSQADQIAALQAQIQSLVAQINALQASQGGQVLGASTTPACLALTRTLYKGSSGADVKRLQTFLSGYPGVVWPASTGITNYYGNVTVATVKAFQKKEGLSKTSVPPINSALGMVDKVTAERIKKLTCHSIAVLSPNGGETFTIGDAINFSWTWNALSGYVPVEPTAYLYSPTKGNVYSKKVATSSEADAFHGDIIQDVGKYKVTICDNKTDDPKAPGKPLCDSSDKYFTVAARVNPMVGLKINGSDGPVTVVSGATSTLSWQLGSSLANSICTKSGAWSGQLPPMDGYVLIYPTQSATYSLSCTTPAGGVASDSVVINVPTVINQGSLTVSLASSSSTPITALPGTTNVTMLSLNLQTSSVEDVRVTSLPLQINGAESGRTNYTVWDGNTLIGNAFFSWASSTSLVTFSNLVVSKGASKTIIVQGDVGSGAVPGDVFSVGYDGEVGAGAVGMDSGEAINTRTGVDLAGPSVTVLTP